MSTAWNKQNNRSSDSLKCMGNDAIFAAPAELMLTHDQCYDFDKEQQSVAGHKN